MIIMAMIANPTTEQTIIAMIIHVAIGDSVWESLQVCFVKITTREYESISLFKLVHFGSLMYVIKNVPFKHPEVLFNNKILSDFELFNVERSTVIFVFDKVIHSFEIIVDELNITDASKIVKFLFKESSTELKSIVL